MSIHACTCLLYPPPHRLLEVLGSGQFGTVTKGVWLREERGREILCEAAVKAMTEEATKEDKVKFLQEAAIMGQFKQANILRIQGIIMDGDMVRYIIIIVCM